MAILVTGIECKTNGLLGKVFCIQLNLFDDRVVIETSVMSARSIGDFDLGDESSNNY